MKVYGVFGVHDFTLVLLGHLVQTSISVRVEIGYLIYRVHEMRTFSARFCQFRAMALIAIDFDFGLLTDAEKAKSNDNIFVTMPNQLFEIFEASVCEILLRANATKV